MRALTQGCEDGGDVWLSHVDANGGSRFGDVRWAHFLSTRRGVVVVVGVEEEEEWQSGKDKEEVGQSQMEGARACLVLCCVLPSVARAHSSAISLMGSLQIT
jgi:hypothetical protein